MCICDCFIGQFHYNEMTHLGSDVCEMQLNGLSEEMSLLLLDFDTDVMEGRAGRGDATCSVSLCSAFRFSITLNLCIYLFV